MSLVSVLNGEVFGGLGGAIRPNWGFLGVKVSFRILPRGRFANKTTVTVLRISIQRHKLLP
jgi:hypothetical protein